VKASKGRLPWLGPPAIAVALLAPRAWMGPLRPAPPESSSSPPPFELTDATEKSGLVNLHQPFVAHPSLSNVGPLLSAFAGAGAAVVDFDGDGWPDVYLTNSAIGSKNRLFRNNHDGTYTDVADKAGLADVNREAGSIRPLFFDYDNDGRPDLLLTTTWCPKLFHNKGGGVFEDVTARSGLTHCGFTLASNVIDVDGDGRLDVLLGDYTKAVNFSSPTAFDFMPNKRNEPDNGGPLFLYRNNGDGSFSEIPGALGLHSPGWIWAIGVHQLFGTGREDVYLGVDFGMDRVFRNEGGRFVEIPRGVPDTVGNGGMAVEVADVDDDGRPLIFASPIYLPGLGTNSRNGLWKALVDRPFGRIGGGRFHSHCGGWMWGAQFVDFDNDSHLDLAVTGGMISGRTDRSYVFVDSSMDASAPMIRADSRNWPAIGADSFAGYEPKCIWLNDGSNSFRDVTSMTAASSDYYDGRALAAIDELNQGRISLVETNWRQPAKLYRNGGARGRHWIGFRLVGRRSNRDGFGSQVSLRLGARTLTRELQPANGFLSERDPRLHFGLGDSESPVDAVVRWPSGKVQRLTGLAADRYHTVTEP
jgi:hypothetical protein